MGREAELLAAIAEAPDDDAPLTIYADWLIEQNNPQGEVIQLSIALARMDDNDPDRKDAQARLDTLWDADFAKKLLEPYKKLKLGGASLYIERGIVSHVSGSPSELARASDALAEVPLITGISVDIDSERALDALKDSPLLARVRKLTFSHYTSPVRPTNFEALGELPELRSISFRSIALGPEDTAVIFRAPKLRSIEISNCRLNKGALESLTLVRSQMRTFDMPAHQAGPRLGELLGAPEFRSLTKLRIPGNDIGSAGWKAMLPSIANLEYLDVRGNQLVTKDIAAIFGLMKHAKELWIGSNDVDNSIAKKLANWEHAGKLRKLHFGSYDLTDEGVLAIAKSKRLTNLRSLVMPGARVKPATNDALLASPALANARIYSGNKQLGRKKYEAAQAKAAKAKTKKPTTKSKSKKKR